MNFSQVTRQDEIAVELKYCERCGGLWLRPLDKDESYCEGCRAVMAVWPRVGRNLKRRETRGKPFKAERVIAHNPLVIETLLGIAETPSRDGGAASWNDLPEVQP